MTYSEETRREIAWHIRTSRALFGYEQVDEETRAKLIKGAIKHTLKKIEEDLEAGKISKRKAAAAKKAVDDYEKRLWEAPLRKEQTE